VSKYLAIYGKPRYLGIIDHESRIEKGETVVVESNRGEELAVVVGELSEKQESEYRLLRNTSEHGDGASKNGEPVVTDLAYISGVTDEDIEASTIYRHEEDGILKNAKELLKPHDLDMKLIDVEFLRNRRKLFFYFSSEQRVDFRAYVRDLAREFKTRIELRQIGVRDEAKVIRGIGPCGLPCCCSYWLNQFAPICIKMVKEQNLALNPAKISGICGRLMCCMCFEHNVYREMWSKLPNPGTKIKTPNGNVIVAGVEIHTNSVRCFIPGRGEIKIPAHQFAEFKEWVSAGKEWIISEESIGMGNVKQKGIFPEYMMTPDIETLIKKDEHGKEKRPPEEKEAASGQDKKTAKKRRRPRKLPASVKSEAQPDKEKLTVSSAQPDKEKLPVSSAQQTKPLEQGTKEAEAIKQRPHRHKFKRAHKAKKPESGTTAEE